MTIQEWLNNEDLPVTIWEKNIVMAMRISSSGWIASLVMMMK